MSAADTTLPVSIPLSRPITAIDRTFTELHLREPTGEDLSEAGYPTRFHANGSTEIDGAAMTRMIARLAGIPLVSARAMVARDWNACAKIIASFL